MASWHFLVEKSGVSGRFAPLLHLTNIIVPFVFSRWHQVVSSDSHSGEATSFLSDFENGFSSSNFDLTGNIAGDRRTGLDPKARNEIATIISENPSFTFDEARALYIKRKMLKSNISKLKESVSPYLSNFLVDEDGTPNDPKAFFFS